MIITSKQVNECRKAFEQQFKQPLSQDNLELYKGWRAMWKRQAELSYLEIEEMLEELHTSYMNEKAIQVEQEKQNY